MPDRRTVLTLVAASPLIVGAARGAWAAAPPVYADGGIAIRGADPVAYFRSGRPVAGSMHHALRWEGAAWLFADASNREAFEADPKAFAPQFGGYCAWALSKGALASVVPEAWTVHEGRLYLNFSLRSRELWRENIPVHVAKAETHWPEILSQ